MFLNEVIILVGIDGKKSIENIITVKFSINNLMIIKIFELCLPFLSLIYLLLTVTTHFSKFWLLMSIFILNVSHRVIENQTIIDYK